MVCIYYIDSIAVVNEERGCRQGGFCCYYIWARFGDARLVAEIIVFGRSISLHIRLVEDHAFNRVYE